MIWTAWEILGAGRASGEIATDPRTFRAGGSRIAVRVYARMRQLDVGAVIEVSRRMARGDRVVRRYRVEALYPPGRAFARLELLSSSPERGGP